MSANPKPTRRGLQPWFNAWQKGVEDVVSQISGQPWHFEPTDEPLANTDSDVLYTIVTAGALQGELALRLPLSSGTHLARMFLQGPAVPDPSAATSKTSEAFTNEDREALEELLRQIAGLAATSLAAAGGELCFQVSSVGPPWYSTADAFASFRTSKESSNNISIEIRISPALASAVESRAANSPASSSDASAPDSVGKPLPSSPHASQSGAPDLHATGCRRLLDVGLAVKLRFGTRRMALRDVLALSSGLVVELEDTLDSPVDLLLDGRIIARGEVVVIDGNYGLRVTSVIDPSPTSVPVV
jgi:flagellar motor switch protein FliN/FliY